jgi:hypothetical protein
VVPFLLGFSLIASFATVAHVVLGLSTFVASSFSVLGMRYAAVCRFVLTFKHARLRERLPIILDNE